MRLSQFPLVTTRESPADAETISHQLMLRTGMIRKLAAGIYTWAPLGLRVLRRVEQVVREEMERAGAVEMLMPAIQPQELWETTGRWEKFGGQLLKIRDRRGQWFCFGPTHEEVVTEYAKETLKSWRQLPLTVFQIQTKFRDEIRPRFGVMRAREFLMKDAYSFHLDDADLDREYQNMFDTYGRIFSRLGLDFRAVSADTGAIGGSASHEFHVLADSGEDLIAFSDGSDYAANVELAEARSYGDVSLAQGHGAASTRVATPGVQNISEVASHFGVSACVCVKTLILQGTDGPVAVALRGDHDLNLVKAGKLPGLGDAPTLLEADAVRQAVGCGVGSIGPVTLPAAMPLLIDRAAAALTEFVCGAGEDGFHLRAASWADLAPDHPYRIVDLRNVVDGDLSPDGHGKLRLARGIEVGHVFALGRTYAEAFGVTVQNEAGQPSTPAMGCYGIGISRIVAAAIEQNHDSAGIIWPKAMAPWDVVVAMINPKEAHPEVVEAADRLVAAIKAAGRSVVLDDRGLRPGAMFADLELIGIPHRVVVSPRGLEQGEFEYRARASQENEMLGFDDLLHRLTRPAP